MTIKNKKSIMITLICSGMCESHDAELCFERENDQIDADGIRRIKKLKELDAYPAVEIVYSFIQEKNREIAQMIYPHQPIILMNPVEPNKNLSKDYQEALGRDTIDFDPIYRIVTKINNEFSRILDESKNNDTTSIAIVADLVIIRSIIRKNVAPRSLQHTIRLNSGEAITIGYQYDYKIATIEKKIGIELDS